MNRLALCMAFVAFAVLIEKAKKLQARHHFESSSLVWYWGLEMGTEVPDDVARSLSTWLDAVLLNKES